jgi:polysaccharide export outer membrane protein
MKHWGGLCAAVMLLALSGCEHAPTGNLPSGAAAYGTIPITTRDADQLGMLRAGDKLGIRVLGEPELTGDDYRIDASGNLQMPLIGEVAAANRTAGELRDEIARRLGARYVRDPQVSVAVLERLRTTFAVEGQVHEPGIFDARPDTTLLGALAEAKSPTDVAKLDQVAVFRTLNGQRTGARFNLKDIRSGAAPDPQILAGDTVVVGFSSGKGAWRDLLKAAPLFNFFYLLN